MRVLINCLTFFCVAFLAIPATVEARGFGAARGGSWSGPRGGSIQAGRVGGVTTGPWGGVHAGGASGVRVTTPGGRTITSGSAGRASVGPAGGVRVGGVGGTAVHGPWGGAAVGGRGGVAVGPFGGVAVGGARTVNYGTRYIGASNLRAQGAVVRRGSYYSGAFTTGWYARTPVAWRPIRWPVANIWAPVPWRTVSVWCGVTAAPIIYDFGSTVIIDNNFVYINGEQTTTAPEFANQAIQFANQGRAADASKEDDWQPLGVFGLVQDDEKVAQNIFQLAVNKAGVVRGNYYNALADTTQPVFGSIDTKSQRVAWSIGDKKNIVYEAGLNNLTQEQTPVLVHYGAERTEQMILVRLEEPKDGK